MPARLPFDLYFGRRIYIRAGALDGGYVNHEQVFLVHFLNLPEPEGSGNGLRLGIEAQGHPELPLVTAFYPDVLEGDGVADP